MCGRALQWIPVLFIVTVIVWSYYAYVVQLCVFFVETIAQKVFYVVIYHGLLAMLAWSYWQTIFTSVGTVPKQFKVSATDLERLEQAENQEAQKQIFEQLVKDLPTMTRTPLGVRFCEKCIHIKPDRCHHCSVCGVCVLKMDHHCPWVNNCVGFTNYKFFLLFLGYAFSYCVFIAFTSLPYFIQFWKNELKGDGKFHVLFLFFVSTMFAISLVSLWGYHIYLVLHNRSTLEAFRPPIFRGIGPDKDGFNLGKLNNFIEVFGEKKSHWFLPMSTSLGDGTSFRCRHPSITPGTSARNSTCSSSVPVTYYKSMDPNPVTVASPSPIGPAHTATSPSSIVTLYQSTEPLPVNMGDGVSFPQRHMDEDEDSLLSSRQNWMEEGGQEANGRSDDARSPSYRIVNMAPLVQSV